MHNLSTVIRFEIVRTLKKKSFWIMSLAFPLMIAAVAGIIYFANKATDDAATDSSKQKFSFAISDDSKLITPKLADAFQAKTLAKQDGINKVKDGSLDAFFLYPSKLDKQPIQIYAKDVGLFDNGRYEAVAKLLLTQSVGDKVAPDVTAVISDKVSTTSTTYKDGVPYDGFKQLIAPGIFLVLFYLLITTFGNQMLNSTTEEKENRVIEMILTTIEARSLIVGKIFALILLGFLQMIIVMLPVVIGYLLLHDQLALPSFDLSSIPIDGQRVAMAAAIFAVSFILFTGLLVAIGAAAPTAKEAGGFFGVVMMLIFGPLYAAPLFISTPDAGIVQFLSLFPFTAPIPLLLRNAVGNLSLAEGALAVVILSIAAIVTMSIAIRVFRYGALEYSRRLSLKEIFTRRA